MSYGLEELSNKYFDGVSKKHLYSFHDIETPNKNIISGVICKNPNYYNGSLVITEVNGVEVEQFVQSMPKIKYPEQVDIKLNGGFFAYEKWDGSCIIMYPLLNKHNEVIEVLYKTRGTVVADKHIMEMVNQCNLNKYKKQIKLDHSYKYYFELYGMDNYHLIKYNTIIDMKVIAMSVDNEFIRPWVTDMDYSRLFYINTLVDGYSINLLPNTRFEGYIPESTIVNSYDEIFTKLSDLLEECNQYYTEDFGYPPIEGVVIQSEDDKGRHHFLKIKPKTIRSHTYEGKVPVASCRKEVLKLFDDYSLDVIKEKTLADSSWYLEIVNEGLSDDFTKEIIHDSQKRIKKTFQNIWERKMPLKGDNDVAQELVKKYPTLTVGELMRKFSEEYPHKKARSSKVYQILTHVVRVK